MSASNGRCETNDAELSSHTEQKPWWPSRSRETHEPNMRVGWQGPLMCSVIFVTSTLGCIFLIFPLIPLLYFHQRLWRRAVDFIVIHWISLPAALMFLFCRTKIIFTGDKFINVDACADSSKSSLIISNHRCRFDWLYVWGVLQPHHGDMLKHLKIILKKQIKLIPGIGWSLQSSNSLFLERKWEADKQIFANSLDYAKHGERAVSLLLYPEGTDFAPGGLERSRAFAEKMNLDFYQYCLHPRTTGFAFIALSMLKRGMLNYVYDITIAYPRNVVETEYDLLRFGTPREVHIHIKRYTVNDIFSASSSSSALADANNSEQHKGVNVEVANKWLNKIWAQKEKLLHEFYSKTSKRSFADDNTGEYSHSGGSLNFAKLYTALIIWSSLTVVWIWSMWVWWPVRIFALAGTLWFTYVGKCCNGLELLEQKLAFSTRQFVRTIYEEDAQN